MNGNYMGMYAAMINYLMQHLFRKRKEHCKTLNNNLQKEDQNCLRYHILVQTQ